MISSAHDGDGEAEDALGDDVPLDLAGAARDAHPGGVEEPVGRRPAQEALGAAHGGQQLLDVELELGAQQLCGRGRGRSPAAGPQQHGAQRLAPHVEPQQLVSPGAAVVEQGTQVVEPALEADQPRPARPALVEQHLGGDTPALVLGAEQGVGGHRDAVEEDLAELVVPGHLPDRSHVDAGGAHVEQEERDAPVAPPVGSGAGQQDAVLGVLGVRRPDLGAVDHVPVAIAGRRCGEAGEVRSGARFGEELAPQHLAGERGREVPAALLVGAGPEDGAAREDQALQVEVGRDLGAGALLGPDGGVAGAEPAPAVLDRPVQPGEAAGGHVALPGAGPLVESGGQDGAIRGTGDPVGLRLREELDDLGPERLELAVLRWAGGATHAGSCSRSRPFTTLPLALRGSSSSTTRCLGCL